jgi:hypothetical protein
MLRSRLFRLLVVLLALPGLFAFPQAAGAGTYQEEVCSPTNSTGIWQEVNTFPTGLVAENLCGGPATGPAAPVEATDEGALYAEDSTETTADIPNGAEAGWTAIAPLGTSITGITYWRSLHAYNQQSLVPGLWNGEGATLESCQSPPEGAHECNSLNNQGPVTFTDLHTTSLFFGVRCDLIGGEYCVPAAPGERHARADLYSATITLSEASSPTISSIAGTGWSGGYLSGVVPLDITASDYSGIASVEARSTVGGVLASAPQSCDYYLSVPCPSLSGATLDLSTAAAPDGPQSIVVTVRDAAGNTSTETSPPVVIDNRGPGAPTSLTATLSGKTVVLSWVDPPAPAAPIASANVTLCAASCMPAGTVPASGGADIATPVPGSYTMHLALTDAAGKTSPYATTSLTVPSSASPSGPKLEAIIDSHGRLYIAGPVPKGVSAARVCWRSKRGRRVLGSRCVTLHVRHGRIAVTFHPSSQARRGRITVTVSKGHSLLARLTATKSRSA